MGLREFVGTVSTIILAILIVVGAIIYFVGLPEEWTQALQSKILQEAGENQASRMVSDQIGKIPKADRKNVEQLQKGIGKATGGDINNPLGELKNRLD